MPQLRIVAAGKSPQAQANARGHLFESLMAEVLRHHSCTIDKKPTVNYAGMEIDIDGHETLSRVPIYAECKCYDTDVEAPKLQAFYGKYMTRWRKDPRCRGLFIALPGLTGPAKGFWREECENAKDTTVTLLEEEGVLKSIYNASITVLGKDIAAQVFTAIGTAGDQILLYTDHGPMWVQYVVPHGSAIADRYLLFGKDGKPITDPQTVEYLQEVYPELNGFRAIPPASGPPGVSENIPSPREDEQVVEVRGSSSWFEYQFPASPEFFVGRTELLNEVRTLVDDILDHKTSARGLLFTGNSGWGKSSAVLASANLLRQLGHFALVIDCRSISSSQSVLRIVDFALKRMFTEKGELFQTTPTPISGFESAVQALLTHSRELQAERRLLFVFLDQFENVFFLPDTLRRLRDLLLKVCDAEANFVLGFAWKTDLIGETSEFPYQERDALAGASKALFLEPFSDVETKTLLDKLRSELRTELRKDLRFFLSEFSQGFPWLLKKLCAHVKTQREAGVPQLEIANRLLNIQQLFIDDLRGLAPEEDDALRRIAKSAPISFLELSEHYNSKIVQSLIDRRLVVRIGSRYDIYWDIFRDFLNFNRVPIQENYLLRMQVGAISKAVSRLIRAGKAMDIADFRHEMKFSEHSAMNVVRDLRLLGLATVESGQLSANIAIDSKTDESEIFQSIRPYVRERLVQNRLVSRLIHELQTERSFMLDEVAERLSAWCPYVTATHATWQMYARILATWMDIADLATFNVKNFSLEYYEPSTEFRERDIHFTRTRGFGLLVPTVQYSPVEQIALEIAESLEGRKPDWKKFSKSTIQKAFATLEDLGFMTKTEKGFRMVTDFSAIMRAAPLRRETFKLAVLKLDVFRKFLSILDKHKVAGKPHSELGRELRELLGVEWKDGTAKTHVKIMLDWARHLNIAPGRFAQLARKSKSPPA